MGIFINGIGAAGGFGYGIDALIQCIETGSRLPPVLSQEAASFDYYPSYVADTSCLNEFVSRKVLRRIDRFSQLALTGACLALKDAGLDSLKGKKTGLVICSGYGSVKTTFSFLDSLIDYGDSCASPTLFSNSVHNSAAGHISIILGIDGSCLTVSQFEMSVHSALISATMWLKEERADRILFGAVDETCDVLKYSYKRFFDDNKDLTMTPLASDRQSAIPGEGAVFFLLSKEKTSDKYNIAIDSVSVNSIFNNDMSFSEDSLFIVNADGHKNCDMHYTDLLPEGALVSCYTPFYGSLPIGPAFDMAIAAISCKEEKIFQSPGSVCNPAGIKIVKENHALDRDKISCIKVGRQGELGLIEMTKHN